MSDLESQVAKLKEELVNQDNRVRLYFTAHETMKRQLVQLKSTLDEIKTLAGSDTCPECMAIENLNELIAKHEDK